MSIFNGAVTLLNLAGEAAQSRRNRCSIRPVLVHWRGGIFSHRVIRNEKQRKLFWPVEGMMKKRYAPSRNECRSARFLLRPTRSSVIIDMGFSCACIRGGGMPTAAGPAPFRQLTGGRPGEKPRRNASTALSACRCIWVQAPANMGNPRRRPRKMLIQK